MKTITPVELQMLIDKGSVELIDVRSKKAFRLRHALGARSVPLKDFEPHSVLAHRRIERRMPLYLMGEKKMIVSFAAGCLAGAGLQCPVVVDGGMQAWDEQALPVVGEGIWPTLQAASTRMVSAGRALLTRAARLPRQRFAPPSHGRMTTRSTT